MRNALLTILLLLLSPSAAALGLGELKLRSYLNQPLLLEIDLHGAEALDAEQLQARIAGEAVYRRLGLSASDRPRDIRFEVIKDRQGTRLKVTSARPMRNSVLELAIELLWPGGRLQRDYPLLLDPAPLASAAPAAKAKPAKPLKPSSSPRDWPLFYPEVRRGDSLGSIAQSLVEGTAINPTQMMLALFQQNPQAFVRGDMGAIKLGARLRVPEYAAVRDMDAEGARKRIYGGYEGNRGEAPPVVAQPAAKPKPAPKPAEPTEPHLELLALDSERVKRMDASELHSQLQRVEENNQRIREENEALYRRLAEMERNLKLLGEQLLATPAAPAAPAVRKAPVPAPAPAPLREVKVEEEDASNIILISVLLALLVLGIGGYIWQQRRWDFYKEI